MNRSDQIDQLATALAKAQGAICAASKDGVNPHFKFKYATLGAVWEACRGPLSANGLSVVQASLLGEHHVVVTTMLAHSSGQWIDNELSLPILKLEPQAIGAAITYARRYALAAMVGVAPEDEEQALARSNAGQPMATEPQRIEIFRLAKLLGQDDAEMCAALNRNYGTQDTARLTAAQADDHLAGLRKGLAARGLVVATDSPPTSQPQVPQTPAKPPQAQSLQEALEDEARERSVVPTGSNGHIQDLAAAYTGAMDSFLALRFPDGPDLPLIRQQRELAREAILAQNGVTKGQRPTTEQMQGLTARLEKRVADLVELRRQQGTTCAAQEVQGVIPEPKSA